MNILRKDTGRWLRVTRSLANISIQQFAHKYGFGYTTIQAWESGRVEISLKAARRLIDAFLQEGVRVSENWLLYGASPFPALLQEDTVSIAAISPPKSLSVPSVGGIKFSPHPHGILYQLSDNSMTPLFNKGEYVEGERGELKDCLYKICIVETLQKTYVRYVIPGPTLSTYNLTTFNGKSSIITVKKTQTNKEEIKVAIVRWHIKPFSFPSSSL